jgi:hypothetical protein
VSSVRRRLLDVWDSIERAGGEDFVQLRRGAAPSWDRIQGWLAEQPRRTALVELTRAGDDVVAIVVRPGQEPVLLPERVPWRALDDAAERLGWEVHQFVPGGDGRETWHRAPARLLTGLADHLAGVDLLHVVPFGPAHHLPLGAVPVAGRPLLAHCPVVVAPSAAFAVRHHSDSSHGAAARPRALVAGDPAGNLPHARAEAARVAARLGTSALLGGEATLAALGRLLPDADLVHLATHVRFDPADPLESAVLLADGERLTARAMMSRHLAAQLLVLSGCESGVQGVTSGDELLGLARALLYAGARSLVLSLWQVNDASSAELMTHVYDGLSGADGREPLDVAHALRRAALAVRDEKPQTFYWAPFALYGDPLVGLAAADAGTGRGSAG